MAVRIYLDNPNPVYTNLDVISGKVVLSINREEAFTAIVVKLECESKTKLASPRSDGRRDYDIELEVHKVQNFTPLSNSSLIIYSYCTKRLRFSPLLALFKQRLKGLVIPCLPASTSSPSSSRLVNPDCISSCLETEVVSFLLTMLAHK